MNVEKPISIDTTLTDAHIIAWFKVVINNFDNGRTLHSCFLKLSPSILQSLRVEPTVQNTPITPTSQLLSPLRSEVSPSSSSSSSTPSSQEPQVTHTKKLPQKRKRKSALENHDIAHKFLMENQPKLLTDFSTTPTSFCEIDGSKEYYITQIHQAIANANKATTGKLSNDFALGLLFSNLYDLYVTSKIYKNQNVTFI